MTVMSSKVYTRRGETKRVYWVSLVKTYLIERGITVAWFCKQIGTTPDALSKIETGKRNAHSIFRAAASMALGEDEANLTLRIVARSRENIDIERDPKNNSRVLSVSLVERLGNGQTQVTPLWKLEEAPWRARV